MLLGQALQVERHHVAQASQRVCGVGSVVAIPRAGTSPTTRPVSGSRNTFTLYSRYPTRSICHVLSLTYTPKRACSRSDSSAMGTRSCVSVSLSRTVAWPSSSDWKSIVTQNGVPISSNRR